MSIEGIGKGYLSVSKIVYKSQKGFGAEPPRIILF